MKHAALLALALGWLPALAPAQQIATTTRQVNLRAGPDRAYPVVAILPWNVQVVVQGCVADYRWCDVAYGPERGWVYAGNLRYAWQEASSPLPAIGAVAGIAILGFVLDDYWGDHYRDRSWYRDRERWVHPPRVVRPPRGGVQPRPPTHVRPAPHPNVRPSPPAHAQPAPRVRPAQPPGPRSNSGYDPRHPNAPRPDRP